MSLLLLSQPAIGSHSLLPPKSPGTGLGTLTLENLLYVSEQIQTHLFISLLPTFVGSYCMPGRGEPEGKQGAPS